MKFKNKPINIRYLLGWLAALSLLAALVRQHFSNKEDILALIQKLEPAAVQVHQSEGMYKTYVISDKTDKLLSYGVISYASGYGGPITLLTEISPQGSIIRITMLENSETPLYLDKVMKKGYPENLAGKEITKPLESNPDIDVVSGATRTTKGILMAVEKGMYQVGKNQLHLNVPNVEGPHVQWTDGAVVGVLLGAIVAAGRNMRKVRPWLLALSVIVLGFVANVSLTLGNYVSILTGKMPSLVERPVWYIMVIGILVVVLFWGKNFYCSWLCPFGAAQEGIYKALNLLNYQVPRQIVEKARKLRWPLIWLAVLLALLYNNPGIASYAPFAVFFSGNGNTDQWLIMGLILLLSIITLRFWCRCFCPVGTVLDFLATLKYKVKRYWRQRSKGLPDENKDWVRCSGKNIKESGKEDKDKAKSAHCSCSSCKAEQAEQRKQSPLDKMMAGLILGIEILILITLFRNL